MGIKHQTGKADELGASNETGTQSIAVAKASIVDRYIFPIHTEITHMLSPPNGHKNRRLGPRVVGWANVVSWTTKLGKSRRCWLLT